jgi:hypothetical protein
MRGGWLAKSHSALRGHRTIHGNLAMGTTVALHGRMNIFSRGEEPEIPIDYEIPAHTD